MEDNKIWESINISKNASKNNLNRHNLKMYMEMTQTNDINKETFSNYFDCNSIDKYDQQTGYYLPHLLFLDCYSESKLRKIFEFIFEIISPYQLTEKEGYSYLDCMFQRNWKFSQGYIHEMLDYAVNELNIDLDEHSDFYGNTLFHWIYVGNAYISSIKSLFPYFHNEYVLFRNNSENVNIFGLDKLTKLLNNKVLKIDLQDDKYIIQIIEDSKENKTIILNNSKINKDILSNINKAILLDNSKLVESLEGEADMIYLYKDTFGINIKKKSISK